MQDTMSQHIPGCKVLMQQRFECDTRAVELDMTVKRWIHAIEDIEESAQAKAGNNWMT